MFNKRMFAAMVVGSFVSASVLAYAEAGDVFPKDNSRDYSAPVIVIADVDSPYPKDNSTDYSVRVIG